MASSSAETDPSTFEGSASQRMKRWLNIWKYFDNEVDAVIDGGSETPVRSNAGPEIEKDVGDVHINIDDDRAFGFTIDEVSRKEIEMAKHGLYMRFGLISHWPKRDKDAGDVLIENGFEDMYYKFGRRIEVSEHGGSVALGWSSGWPNVFKSSFFDKAGKGIEVDEYGGEKLGDILLGSTAQVGSSLIVYHLTSSTTPSAGSYILGGANGVAFVVILMSKLLGGYKNKRAALLLRKLGSIAASCAIIMAMTMFLPVSHRLWVSSLACLLPAVAVALA